MDLQESVARAFAPDGELARCIDTFSPRVGQLAMADAVADTLERGGILAVEAGTGVGKTFAYLVPALLSGQRILLSTATKTLQDQLFGRDIPRLLGALGLPVRTALLKGRSSYLCTYRLGFARQDLRAMHPSAQEDLTRIELWSKATRAGDMAELSQLDERSPVIALVTSTRENCLGARCSHVQTCHVNQARREAMAADVVVINHHLFFADVNIRESGVAELLPTAHAVVFDEAHQLNAIGIQFLGCQLSTAQLDAFCRDLERQGSQLALAGNSWRESMTELVRDTAALRGLFSGETVQGRLAWAVDVPAGVSVAHWRQLVSVLQASLQRIESLLRSLQEHAADIQAMCERATRLLQLLNTFVDAVQPGWVRWVETGHQVKLLQSPLDIAESMRSRVLDAAGGRNSKSWIFTSATLGLDANLTQFVQSCGLEGARVLQVSSPFDYPRQACLYIPSHFPKPADAGHSAAVAELAAQGASVLRGRTLVLTTTLRAMRDIAAALRHRFSASDNMEVLLQGEAPKRELTERFGQKSGVRACVLVASVSFWEGVDIPGDALQLVVIDKLPFAPPDDPQVEARAREMQANGKNPFAHLHVPQAAIALKQGAGRLIRSETDRGILVVCDVRLAQMGYGRRILAALPAMRSITTQDQFAQALLALTTPSTTGCQ